MNRRIVSEIAGLLLLLTSCSSYKYFYDTPSRDLQQKLRTQRTGNAFFEGFKVVGAFVFALLTNSPVIDYNPDQKEFKNLNLFNSSPDTLFVNMLSDVKWDTTRYCDFMDIRIPPGKNCRMLVPKYTNYNIYFSNTPDPDDDEKIEINTEKFRKIAVYSGLTKNDTIQH